MAGALVHTSWSFRPLSGACGASATVEEIVADDEVFINIAEVLDMSLSELFLDVDRETPKELARLSAAMAGQPIGIQRWIFRVVEEMLGAVRELRH